MLEQAVGIEPTSSVWKTEARPLDQARMLAKEQGFEPQLSILEIDVLPLHYPSVELWWNLWGSNPEPCACKAPAPPVELRPRNVPE
jgi:hypothetical protein